MNKITYHESQLKTAQTQRARIEALNALAFALGEDHLERAYQLSEEAYQLCQSGDFQFDHYQSGMVDSLNIKAWYYSKNNLDLAAGLKAALQALTLSKNSNYTSGQMQANRQCGLIYHNVGQYPQALDHYFAALTLAQQEKDQYQEAQTFRAIARLYAATEDSEKMLAYTQQALDIFSEIGDDYYSALLLNNASLYYSRQGKHEEAVENGLRSLEIFRALDSWSGQATIEDTLAEVYMRLEDYENALSYIKSCLDRQSESKQKARYAFNLLTCGRIYLHMQRPELALPYLMECLNLSEAIGLSSKIYESHQAISEAYEQQEELKLALLHHKHYLHVYQNVINEKNLQKLNLLEVIYRVEQAESEAETQRQLREQDRQHFELLSEMRDQLISSTSHDLKNPLGSILNYAYLLSANGTTTDENGQHYLNRIEALVNQMRDLISNLLELAQLETGRALNRREVSLQQFTEHLITDFLPQARQKGIHLEAAVKAADQYINIDDRLMQRVFNNLISNAIKYTPNGGQVQVLVSQTGSDVSMSIEDTGLGIPSQDIPHIFERFYRVKNDLHAEVDGTGLGLAIAKSIIEQHGGMIKVESELEKGTTFYVNLPDVIVSAQSS